MPATHLTKTQLVERMDAMRLERGLTQLQAVVEIGITLTTYNGFRTPRRDPETMSDIVEAKIRRWLAEGD